MIPPQSDDAAYELISGRARGTPRIAKKLLRRVRDFAQVEGTGRITTDIVEDALVMEGIDEQGLDAQDRSYLDVMARNYRGGPVGVETLAAALSEDRETLEATIEPFLMQQGLLQRTPRGRLLTVRGYEAIGWASPHKAAHSGAFPLQSTAGLA